VSSELPIAQRLRKIIDRLKAQFVGRDEVIDLIALALVAGEHLFLLGRPGTAKSALIRQFAMGVHGRYFEYMLTRFTEPTEIFGPVDLARLREGTVATVTTGMLPEAEFVFLDELFNANSAILNNLLTVLNERVYRRGAEIHRLPMLSLFSASNQLPEDDALQALFDRFLLRCRVASLGREALPRLLTAGWSLESNQDATAIVSAEELREFGRDLRNVRLEGILECYADTVAKIRDLGIQFSDRRVVKALRLIAASALLCERQAATIADLWVLRYLWDREEQIDPLALLINGILEQHPTTERTHGLAVVTGQADAEDLARQLDGVEQELDEESPSLSKLARLREQVTALADKAVWVADQRQREHLQSRARKLLEKLA
jgi:MoxR-like ATPase